MIAWSFLSSVSPEGHVSHCFLAVGGPCESACGLIGSIFNTFQSFYELLSLIWVFLVCFGLLGYTCGHFASVCFVSFCRWYLKIFFYDFTPGLPAVSLAGLVPTRLIKPGIMRSPTSSADLFNIPSIILTSHPSLTLAWGMQGPIRPKVPLALPSPLPPFLSHAFFIVLYS